MGNITEIQESVACPLTLAVDGQTVSSPQVFEACEEVSSENTTIQAPGGIVFRSGQQVALGNGFSIGSGAQFSVSIAPRLDQATTFSYAYQDHHYFLVQAAGPWGTLDYTYDKIGNRLSETRDAVTDTYSYVSNGVGNTPILASIALGAGGTRDYTYGVAGHLEEVAEGTDVVDFASDDAGRLAQLDRLGNQATMTYDGRSFLEEVEKPLAGGADAQTTEPTYSSDGLLHALSRQASSTATPERFSYFYFAGRPVAQLEQVGASVTWTFLTADHLGTSFVATDLSGVETWVGPFEPFGRDVFQGSGFGALENAIYLRLPGQWEDGTWEEASLGAERYYYNLNRWYSPALARYSRADPWGLDQPQEIVYLYAYADGRPLLLTDRLGLFPDPPNDFFDCVYCLFERSNRGLNCTEQAAWVTLGSPSDGPGINLDCVVWPRTGMRGQTSWRGRIPAKTVAQAHTHPTRCPDKSVPRGPQPSPADKDLADGKQTTNFRDPVCTVSASGIWCHWPNAKRPRRVAGPSWWKEPKKRNCEPCDGISLPD